MGKLKLCRKKCGLSIEEAAAYLGISRNTLSAYEAGEKSPPLTVTAKMLKLYNSKTIDLLGVNVPEMELTEQQKLYLTFCEYAVSAVNHMERSLINAGYSKYSKERRDELYNRIFMDFAMKIKDTQMRDWVIELHMKEVI